jgi:hypothetical protein
MNNSTQAKAAKSKEKVTAVFSLKTMANIKAAPKAIAIKMGIVLFIFASFGVIRL